MIEEESGGEMGQIVLIELIWCCEGYGVF